MSYYPAFLNLAGRRAVVFGGGAIAEHKVEALLSCDASVTVISPKASDVLETLSASGAIGIRSRCYEPGDCSGAFIVIAATDDIDAQKRIHLEAQEAGALINVVDEPEMCDFIAPAVVGLGDITIAISTNGKSPTVASLLRKRIAQVVGAEYPQLVELLGRYRPEIRRRITTFEARRDVYSRIVADRVLDDVRGGDLASANRRIRSIIDTAEAAGGTT